MAYANLNKEGMVIDGFDSIIIVKDLADIPCGVTLDVTAVTDNVVKAGHVLVQNKTTKVVKPLGITSGLYDSIDSSSEEYYGILKSSVLKSMPMAAVLRIGTVNAAAAAKFVGAEITSTIKAGLPHIDFIY